MTHKEALKIAKPILFNTEMVRAIQNGTKTVTRRVIKSRSPKACGYRIVFDCNGKFEDVYDCDEIGFMYESAQSRLHIGDILYVRETYCAFDSDHIINGVKYAYKSDLTSESERVRKELGYKWKPSIHMPKEAARIFLRVTDVRVERLQDSFFKSGSTIFALLEEGVDIGEQCRECIDTYGSPYCIDDESECGTLDEVRSDYSDLWNSTVKKSDLAKYGWAADPWVGVIEFERIEVE